MDNIKTDVKELGYYVGNWMGLARDRDESKKCVFEFGLNFEIRRVDLGLRR